MYKSKRLLTCCFLGFFALVAAAQAQTDSEIVTYGALKGLERDPDGFVRRDNSDIIKVGDLYYVWYSKMNQRQEPTISSIWYATSPDGHTWTEKGQCLDTGKSGAWDDRYVYTPGILVANSKYYLFYTAQSTVPRQVQTFIGNYRGIGIAVSDSADGPWKKLPANPVLLPSDNVEDFDSHVVDDACLIVRDGKFWLYYKGRQIGKGPTETKMGVAIAANPAGPYVKHSLNPLAEGGHEVLVWPEGEGVAALVGMKLGEEVPFYLMYAEDGLNFKKTGQIPNANSPWAPRAYRPEAFTDSDNGEKIRWGLHIGGKRPDLFLERFDLSAERD